MLINETIAIESFPKLNMKLFPILLLEMLWDVVHKNARLILTY